MSLANDANFFENLPSEIIHHINELLDPGSRLRFCSTNRRHHRFLQEVAIQINQSNIEEILTSLQYNQNKQHHNFLGKVEKITLHNFQRNNISI